MISKYGPAYTEIGQILFSNTSTYDHEADWATDGVRAIALAIAQILFLWMIRKKVTAAQYAGLALILIFGGLTILLKDEIFIKLKPSILYALFAIVLLGSNYIYKINLPLCYIMPRNFYK